MIDRPERDAAAVVSEHSEVHLEPPVVNLILVVGDTLVADGSQVGAAQLSAGEGSRTDVKVAPQSRGPENVEPVATDARASVAVGQRQYRVDLLENDDGRVRPHDHRMLASNALSSRRQPVISCPVALYVCEIAKSYEKCVAYTPAIRKTLTTIVCRSCQWRRGGQGRPLPNGQIFLRKAAFSRKKAYSSLCAFAINYDGADTIVFRRFSPPFKMFGSATGRCLCNSPSRNRKETRK